MIEATETEGRENARRLLAEAFGCEPAEVPDTACLGDPAAWDSLGHMRLVLALEAATGRALSTDEIIGIENLDDVAAILAATYPLGTVAR